MWTVFVAYLALPGIIATDTQLQQYHSKAECEQHLKADDYWKDAIVAFDAKDKPMKPVIKGAKCVLWNDSAGHIGK